MKCTRVVWSSIVSVSLMATMLLAALPSKAGTVAWWRFENGAPGAQMAHGAANGVWAPDVPDSSGNGNALSVWTGEGFAGYKYTSDVPFPTVPETGAPNTLSVKNTGGVPGMWNNTLRAWTPAAFTIEASFKPETGGWRTIVGRDSLGAGTQGGADPNASALYFQIQPDNNVAITFEDVSGYRHTAVSAPGLIHGFDYPSDNDGLKGTWYSMAGVSDGSTLSLYLNDLKAGTGYQLVAQTNLTLSGSANTAFTPGLGSGSDWTAGDFSVGRGLYGGGHGDRAYGFIDEVRLTEGALAPSQFLASPVPEPGTLALVLSSGLLLIRRRRTAR